jgi:glycosyltransferase involved in cell wall biosynthesis
MPPREHPWLCLGRLCSALREFRPEIVHTHLFFANILGRLAARVSRCRIVVSTLHNPDYTHDSARGLRSVARKAIDRLTGRLNSALVAVSLAVAEDYRRHMGWRAIEVIPNGLDLDRFCPASADPSLLSLWSPVGLRLISVGRLHRQKGHDVLLDALALCQKAGHSHSLVVVGDGPLRQVLEARAKDLGCAVQVNWLGARSDVLDLLRAADVFVFPSRFEAQGVALLEAMACEKAIVATSVGGIPEVVADRRSALLVPPDDPVALAKAIESLAVDAAYRQCLAREALRRAQDFDIRATVSRIEQLYERLCTTAA